jgi:uncharacterized membrane protein
MTKDGPLLSRGMPMPSGTLKIDFSAIRTVVLCAAVLLMNYTLLRPSPVDIAFVVALGLCVFVNQRVTVNFFVFLMVVAVWYAGVFASSIKLLGGMAVMPGQAVDATVAVPFELLTKAFVILIALVMCHTVQSWGRRELERFLKVYVASSVIAAALGIFGFATGNEELLWDGRAKGLFDDPNMYAAFLLPGLLSSMYFVAQRRSALATAALVVILVGVLVGFSRAAVGSMLVTGGFFLVFLNRNNLVKAGLYFLAFALVGVVLAAVGLVVLDGFGDKLADRLTLAKEYDAGHGGRYNRYLLAWPIILDNPLGIGILEVYRYFPEPIHNIVLSSFLNYGWISGCAWLLLMLLSVRLAIRNWQASKDPLAVLSFLCAMSVILCALLHQGEHWRHLWMMLGLFWGFNAAAFAAVPARAAPSPSVAPCPAAAASPRILAVRKLN